MKSPVSKILQTLHDRYRSLNDGAVADYIPELTKVDPELFGICIATRDGHIYEVGDTRHRNRVIGWRHGRNPPSRNQTHFRLFSALQGAGTLDLKTDVLRNRV